MKKATFTRIARYVAARLGSGIVTSIAVMSIISIVLAQSTTTWNPGQAPQANPDSGNVKPPVFAGGAMTADRYCVATGNGDEIICDSQITEITVSSSSGGGTTTANTPSWEVVDLNLDDNFDENCRYRMKTRVQNSFTALMGVDPVLYPIGVASNSLTVVHHNGVVSHVNSDSKALYRVDGSPVVGMAILSMERNCSQ